MKRGWYAKGRDVAVKFNYTREKFHAFGALGNKELYCQFYERTNQDAFIDFIEALRREHGKKLLLFFDNARWHTGQKVQQYLLRMERNIKTVLFPSYSPELNPIEIQWREIRKALGNKFFRDTEEMIEYMFNVVPTGAVPMIKLFDYLTP